MKVSVSPGSRRHKDPFVAFPVGLTSSETLWRSRSTDLDITKATCRPYLKKTFTNISPVGSGKSILCALVIQYLTRARRHDDSRQIVVPLIFSYNNDYTHNVTFLTYTILAYLCSAEPIPEAIVKARKAHVSPSEIAEINDLIMNVLVSLGETNAAGSTDSTTSVVLAIDALDEIPLESQITNMELLNRLTAAIKTGCGLRVRVALFTRHDNRLQPLCHSRSGWHRTVIPRSRVDEDIRTAVGVRLEKGTRLIKADREKLADRVVDKAAGM